MKKFEVPTMNVMKLTAEDVITDSSCRVEALGCASCYCVVLDCDEYDASPTCTGCYTDWG